MAQLVEGASNMHETLGLILHCFVKPRMMAMHACDLRGRRIRSSVILRYIVSLRPVWDTRGVGGGGGRGRGKEGGGGGTTKEQGAYLKSVWKLWRVRGSR